MEGASFGAGRAGGGFDPVEFLKQPQTILRIISWVFSIVVFGSLVNEGTINVETPELYCIYNQNDDACNYAITIGVVAFFASTGFFVLDIYFPQISSVKDRKKAVMIDMGFSAVWTFLWFVSFCFLSDQWRKTSYPVHQGADAARAGIVFSFFSIFSWCALAVKAMQRYRLGTDMSLFAGDQIGSAPNAGYPGYPTGSGIESTTDTYQSPPFTENMDSSTKGYQVPSY
ncbi:synaptogyrin-3 [Xenopus laevis]|uniref:Synaptogyrin n=2 Tax=Xenopus laevis TaxID=8355 RepID=A0A974H4R5_XENLA|nr:synaptogyrin-3 [Xenopus laevis]OCT64400.1 hypothetical protein XELAEV_18045504mg [Xenopus laevis]